METTFLLIVAMSGLLGSGSNFLFWTTRTACAGASLLGVAAGGGVGFINWLIFWRVASLSCSGVVCALLGPDKDPLLLGPRPPGSSRLAPLELDLYVTTEGRTVSGGMCAQCHTNWKTHQYPAGGHTHPSTFLTHCNETTPTIPMIVSVERGSGDGVPDSLTIKEICQAFSVPQGYHTQGFIQEFLAEFCTSKRDSTLAVHQTFQLGSDHVWLAKCTSSLLI